MYVTWPWVVLALALLSGGAAFVLAPRFGVTSFALAGRPRGLLALGSAAGAGVAGAITAVLTEPLLGMVAAMSSGALALGVLFRWLRVPRTMARAFEALDDDAVIAIAAASLPPEAERGKVAGQTWALWMLGFIELSQDNGRPVIEQALLDKLENYPLNPFLVTIHRVMAAYFLMRDGRTEAAQRALSAEPIEGTGPLRARVMALEALLAALDRDLEGASAVLDRWYHPAAAAPRIRALARANLLAAEDDPGTRVAVDAIEARWGPSGLAELRALGGPAEEFLLENDGRLDEAE